MALLPMFNHMTSYGEELKLALFGIYAAKPDLLSEINELIELWNFYLGEGQVWDTNDKELSYVPSKRPVNFTKELLDRQNLVMSNKSFKVIITAVDNKSDIEPIKKLIEKVNDNSRIQNVFKVGDLHKSVLKRCLLRVYGDRDSKTLKIITQNPMEWFDSSDDNGKMVNLSFHYITDDTYYAETINRHYFVGNFDMENGKCYWSCSIKDSDGKMLKMIKDHQDTGLTRIPAVKVVNNEAIDEYKGYSDVEELRDLQTMYNIIYNAMMDNIGFDVTKMMQLLTDAAVSVVNIETDPVPEIKARIFPGAFFALGPGEKLEWIENPTNIPEIIKVLDKLKSDACALKQQPTQEQLSAAKSGKEIENTYNGLAKLCSSKFGEWDDKLKEIYRMVVETNNALDIYPEYKSDVAFNIEIIPSFDIFDDEESMKTNLLELGKQGKISTRTLLEKVAEIEDSEAEWKRIQEEAQMKNEQTNDSYLQSAIDAINNPAKELTTDVNGVTVSDKGQSADKTKPVNTKTQA